MVDENEKNAAASTEVDYSLSNPDVVTKYKDAASISQRVLEAVEKAAVEGVTIVSLCEKGDKLLEEETAKVYKGKKINKGIGFPTTISPSDIITPYSPLQSTEEAAKKLKAGQIIKIQLGAQIDGFAAIVGSSVIVPAASGDAPKPTEEQTNLLLATHYCNEVLLRLLLPPSINTTGAAASQDQATERKPYTPPQINSLLKKVCETFNVNLCESTTSYQFERNEIEGKKRIVLNPGEGIKGEGMSDVLEAWGVEVAVSAGSGKAKTLELKSTLFRKTGTTFMLKRGTSKQTYSEVVKKFGTFPFSLRMLSDERTAKMGVLECVRYNVLRQYEVQGEKDGSEVARIFTTILITKNGVQRITSPTKSLLDIVGPTAAASAKKIEDKEILALLEIPLNKNKPKKKK